MESTRRRAVINANARDLDLAERLVREGRYASVSDLVRRAMRGMFERLERERLAEQVERYCRSGFAGEDADLVRAQAFSWRRGRRATR